MHTDSTGRLANRAGGWLTLALLAASLLTGCLIPEKQTECSNDEQCREEYGPGAYCADDQICDYAMCDDDEACRREHGPRGFCSEAGRCGLRSKSQYLAAPCDYGTEGPVFEKGTYNIGVIMAQELDLIQPIVEAIRFAQNDINVVSGVDGHQLGLILCDTEGSNEKAEAAAQHLADIGVQAVIGPDFSSYSVEVVPSVLAPNEILTVSPTATSVSLDGVDDNGFFWRTAASDAVQTPPIAKLVKRLIDVVIPKDIQPNKTSDEITVGMMTRNDDAYASGLRNGVVEELPSSLLDSDRFKAVTYPNLGRDEGSDYTKAAGKIADEQPDIVLLWGLEEVWTIIGRVDGLLQDKLGQTPKTIYVTADGGKTDDAAMKALEKRPSLKGRVWGTAPRSPGGQYKPFKNFKVRYNQDTEFSVTNSFVPNAYDAVYTVALAAAAAREFDGPKLVEGMKKLTDPRGVSVVADQQEVTKGFLTLKEGKTIDFRGASGPLDFDDNGSRKSSTISLWCLTGDGIQEGGILQQPGSDGFRMQRCDEEPVQ